MPCIGLSSFLQALDKMNDMSTFCVNALYRAFFISTKGENDYEDHKFMCQCPVSGFLHFYVGTVIGAVLIGGCVNALYRAFFISTTPCGGIPQGYYDCVNALYRAFFISTQQFL